MRPGPPILVEVPEFPVGSRDLQDTTLFRFDEISLEGEAKDQQDESRQRALSARGDQHGDILLGGMTVA
jgi:hypothetical protein